MQDTSLSLSRRILKEKAKIHLSLFLSQEGISRREQSMSSSKPHAVVVPYPAQGHINPFMQLAKQLAIQGFSITFVNTDHNHARILQSQSSPPQNLGLDIRLVSIPDGLPPDHNRMADFAELSQAIDLNMPLPFEALLRKLLSSNPPASCVFSDVLMLFTQDVAHKLGLPRAAVWLQSAASFAVNLRVPRLIREGYLPLKVNSIGKFTNEPITSIPGHPPLAAEDIPSFFQTQDMSDYMAQFKIRPFQRLHEANFILINSFYEMEREVVDALQHEHRVLAAGPFLPPALLAMEDSLDNRTGTGLWPEDNECLQWLDRQDPSSVLYISFGSIASLSSAQFRELALGLEASQKPLLWAIRPDVKDLVVAALPPSFLKDGSDRIYLTSWAPQALVLSHKSVGGFLTHCGWNSTLESISMGVPMLCWPYFADQMLNRKWMVDEWKIGKSFEPSSTGMVTKEEIERLVRLLMEGQEGREMRERARGLSDAAKKAVQEKGSSFVNWHNVQNYFLRP